MKITPSCKPAARPSEGSCHQHLPHGKGNKGVLLIFFIWKRETDNLPPPPRGSDIFNPCFHCTRHIQQMHISSGSSTLLCLRKISALSDRQISCPGICQSVSQDISLPALCPASAFVPCVQHAEGRVFWQKKLSEGFLGHGWKRGLRLCKEVHEDGQEIA